MNNHDDFFMRMCKEAAAELAKGDISWKDCPPNTLIMAAFGMLSNHLANRVVKPLWFIAGSAITGTIGVLITYWAS